MFLPLKHSIPPTMLAVDAAMDVRVEQAAPVNADVQACRLWNRHARDRDIERPRDHVLIRVRHGVGDGVGARQVRAAYDGAIAERQAAR